MSTRDQRIEELAAQVQAGHKDAWDDFWGLVEPELRRTIGAKVANNELVDLALGRVTDWVIRDRLTSWNPQRGPCLTYLKAAARLRAVDVIRDESRKRRPLAEADVIGADAPDDESLMASLASASRRLSRKVRERETQERMLGAIPTLPPRQRAVIEGLLGGAAAKEIAEELGVSEATVAKDKAKALAQLRRVLGGLSRNDVRDLPSHRD